MKTAFIFFSYIVGIGELILALYFFATHSQQTIRKIMGLFSFFMALWVILNALTSYREPSVAVTNAVPFIYFSVVMLVTLCVHFGLLFPFQQHRLDRLHVLLLYLLPVMMAFPIFGTSTIISGYRISPEIPGYTLPGPLYPLFAGYMVIGFCAFLALLISKIRKSSGDAKRNGIIVLLSLLIPGAPGLFFIVFGEWRGAAYNTMIAPMLTSVWLVLTSYIVLKKS